ncbi:lysophospholipase [Polaribacter sp. IC073]|nr:lysophospholipase [Polaribacter sp. IC073]
MVYFLFALVGFIFIGLYFFQEKFIFLNGKRIDRNYQYEFTNTFEEVLIKTDGSNEVNALHFKLENPQGIVLFCHGNSGNLQKWGNRVSCFLDSNYEAFVFDYRNYGKSTGRFNEEKMYTDALLSYNHIKTNFKEDKIVVYGFSLGSTFATRIAALNVPKELILEAPFYNFKKAVQFYSKLAPTFLLKYKFRTDLDIVKVTAPISIFHGTEDQTTSFKDAKDLLERSTSTKNNFIQIDGGTHHNIRDYVRYQQQLQEILAR